MNVFNRLAVIFGLVLAIICLPTLIFTLLFVPGQVADVLRQVADNIDAALSTSANPLGLGLEIRQNAVLAALVSLLLLIFCLLLLWREVRPGRARTVKVQRSGGEADVSIDSIAHRLEHHVGGLADVFKVKPEVTRKGKGVAVELEVEISPEIDVPIKEEEIRRLTTEIIEERMGLKLGKLTIHIVYPKPGRGSIWERMPKTFGRLLPPLREAGEVPLIPQTVEHRPTERAEIPTIEPGEPLAPPPQPVEEVAETAGLEEETPPLPPEEMPEPAWETPFEEEKEEEKPLIEPPPPPEPVELERGREAEIEVEQGEGEEKPWLTFGEGETEEAEGEEGAPEGKKKWLWWGQK